MARWHRRQHRGKRWGQDRLANPLTRAAEARRYVVTPSLDDQDFAWVTEAWTNREAHQASLKTRAFGTWSEAQPVIAVLKGPA